MIKFTTIQYIFKISLAEGTVFMSKLNKKMVSFSMIPVIIFLCFVMFVILLAYLFFGRASMSAGDKLDDMIKYTNQYSESFLNRTNFLYLYVDSSNVDYYSDYMNENIATGDMNTARNMLLAIGINEDEKAILKQIDSAWKEYIDPAEQKALNKMIQEADQKKAREFISSNEYTSCIKYIYNSQKTLSNSIINRLREEKKNYELWQSVFQIVLIFITLIIIVVSFAGKARIKRLGIMVENERESQKEIRFKNEVLKRREMRNARRKR